MAAESLENAAKAAGHVMKVETQGSAGTTPLSAAEIAAADAVIFAHDLPVKDAGRFAGKPIVDVGVKKGISDGPALIEEAALIAAQWRAHPQLAAEAMSAGPAVQGGLATKVDNDASTLTKLRQWLMTGVSYMIPFVAAGGILIAISFMLAQVAMGEQGAIEIVKYGLTAEGDFNITQSFNPLSLTSWAALFFVIGGAAFGFLVPILSGFIAFAIADRPGLVPGIVGGFDRVDDGRRLPRRPGHRPRRRLRRPLDLRLEGAQGRARRHAGRRHPAALDASSRPGCSSPCSAARSWP